MENILISDLMNILNDKLNNVVSFKRKFDVFSQKGGVGCYDTKKWAIFVPDNLDVLMQLHIILHEGAHLILREKLSKKINYKKFDRLKWSMEPFFIDNSIFSIDEAFAELVTINIINKLPKKLFKKKIIFDKTSEQSYKGSNKNLDIFLAKISSWKIPITIKNNNLNIGNIINNLTFVKPKNRINFLLNSFPFMKEFDYELFINNIVKNPECYSSIIKLSQKIHNFDIDNKFKKFDKQIFLDYLEVVSWLDYTEKYFTYDDYFHKTKFKKIKIKSIKLDDKFERKLLKISDKLKKTREKIVHAWKDKKKENLKRYVSDYNNLRWQYREKIDLKNNFNKFGFGRFKNEC